MWKGLKYPPINSVSTVATCSGFLNRYRKMVNHNAAPNIK